MANIVEVYNEITSPGVLDTKFNMSQPLQLPASTGPIKLQVCSITMSDRIPNIFDAGSKYAWNNTLCRVRTHDHNWVTIQLPTGLYPDAESIALAINNVIGVQLDWYHDQHDPGIIFSTNTITDTISITVDSGKLKAGDSTLTLDFTKSSTGTDLAITLGFSEVTASISAPGVTSVTVSSNQYVRMDTQGTSADIWCNLVANRRRNNVFTRSIAEIIFAGKTTASENVYPTSGMVSPLLVYDGPRTVKEVNVQIKTLDGNPMIFMGGRLFMSIMFLY
jgi:hypothetical protein